MTAQTLTASFGVVAAASLMVRAGVAFKRLEWRPRVCPRCGRSVCRCGPRG